MPRSCGASPYLRQAFYRELAGRLERLGYEPYAMTSTGFSVRGVEHLRERFSKRAREIKALTEAFSARKGRQATQREIDVIVRESRPNKLAEVTTPEVRARQRAELTATEAHELDLLVRHAMDQIPGEETSLSQAEALRIVEAALRHVYERRSVAREGEVRLISYASVRNYIMRAMPGIAACAEMVAPHSDEEGQFALFGESLRNGGGA